MILRLFSTQLIFYLRKIIRIIRESLEKYIYILIQKISTFGKSRKIEIVTQISFLDIFLIILDSIDRYKFIETFQKHSRLYILILYNIQQDNDTTTIIWLCKSHEYTKIRLLLVYYSEQCIIITIVVFCRLVTSIVP